MSRLRAVRLVAMREILERGRSRGYVLSLVFTVFLLAAGFVLPSILLGNEEEPNLALVGSPPAGLQGQIVAVADQYDLSLDISAVPDRAAAEEALRAKTIDAALDVPSDLSGPGQLIVLEQADDQLRAITAAAVIGLRAGSDAALLSPPTISALEPPTEEQTTAVIFANAGIILMFIGIFSYGTWVLTGVVEEKQSRVVEVVLTTVRPRDLLIGKVLGIGLLALVQLIVLVIAGMIATQLSGRLSLPATTTSAVVQLLLWFVLGFAFYSTAMGFLGSLASRIEEASNATLPVTMLATLSYLLAILVVTQEPDGIVANVLTFLPPSAPMVVPLRAALDAIEPWQIGLSIALMLVAIWALFVVGGRVYSGAVLQTGGRMKLRDAWRASR
ncbi:MAG TPA: ABC transporter permease [Candidatus Limnocylindrales bacterium]